MHWDNDDDDDGRRKMHQMFFSKSWCSEAEVIFSKLSRQPCLMYSSVMGQGEIWIRKYFTIQNNFIVCCFIGISFYSVLCLLDLIVWVEHTWSNTKKDTFGHGTYLCSAVHWFSQGSQEISHNSYNTSVIFHPTAWGFNILYIYYFMHQLTNVVIKQMHEFLPTPTQKKHTSFIRKGGGDTT